MKIENASEHWKRQLEWLDNCDDDLKELLRKRDARPPFSMIVVGLYPPASPPQFIQLRYPESFSHPKTALEVAVAPVAASIQAAFPDRGPAVEDWLASEPCGETIPKSYGYSYLAKWYAEHGADDFLREIWRDEAVARELRKRLEATGAWKIVEDLVAD